MASPAFAKAAEDVSCMELVAMDIERLKASISPEQIRSARSRADDWIAAHPAAMAASTATTR